MQTEEHNTKAKKTLFGFSFIVKLMCALLVCLLLFVVAIAFGAADISFKEVLAAFSSQTNNAQIDIIREIRLPREFAALFVGAALAVAGTIMQGMTRNPLADPGLFGLSAGATVALSFAVAFIPDASYFAIMIASFIGAAVGGGIVFGIASLRRGGFSSMRIVLAGAAVSAFLFAIADGIGIVFKVSKQTASWRAGGMVGTTWDQLQVIVPFIIVGIIVAILLSRQLTVLSLDESVATGLGQKTFLVKVLLFIVIVILVGAGVSLAGNMTFIGLMIPHIVRAIVGQDYRLIIPMSVLVGGSFMLIADTIGRTIHAPYETSVPAIVAILGLPFFLFIVKKGGRFL